MRKVFGLSGAIASIIWLGSSLSASAQQLPDGLSAPPEFWSTRYQRFYETQHDPIVVANTVDRPVGNLMAPPDVIVDDAAGVANAGSQAIAAGGVKPAPDTTTGTARRD
jgi:hypothetical protein